jgi:hypothetical protein
MKREQLVVDEPTPDCVSGGSAPAPGPRRAWYAILVAGALPPGSGAGLDGFRATVSAGADGPITELVGEVADQATLLQALRGLHQRRAVLLEVTRLSGPPPRTG